MALCNHPRHLITTLVSLSLMAVSAGTAAPQPSSTNKTPTKRTQLDGATRGSLTAVSPAADASPTMGDCYLIPHDVRIERYVAGARPAGETKFAVGTGDGDACRYNSTSVYCNTLGNRLWQPPLNYPTQWVADDISIAGVPGCQLDRYVIMVSGSTWGIGEGPYAVEAALYPFCPNAFGPDLTGNIILGTECHASFDDNGIKVVTCPVAPGVVLPPNVFLGIRFSRLNCAIVVGAPAMKGFSADTLDFPGYACKANLGGYVPSSQYEGYGAHASFYAELYVRDNCSAAFPAYKSTNRAGLSYTPGGGIRFADDISLAAHACNMVAYEVAVKGNGVTQFDLRTRLDDSDPVNGGVIVGTHNFIVGALGAVIRRFDFDPPVPLPTSDLWISFVTASAVTGPVITDHPADLGGNIDAIWVHDETRWRARPLTDGRYAVTDVTIFCEGTPPTGACCDMVFTTNLKCVGGPNDGGSCERSADCPDGTCIGDSLCRDDLPEMNCPFTRWIQGASCEDDPFTPGCGLSACCTYSNICSDLTERECYERPPVDQPRLRIYQLGRFCDDWDQKCPWGACLGREGDCRFPRDEPGCEDPFCCVDVCERDSFCCHVVWDEYCVFEAADLCHEPAPNDECAGRDREGAMLLEIPSSVPVFAKNATADPSDHGFCCHDDDIGAQGAATLWYKFVAPLPAESRAEFSSILLSTCVDEPSGPHDSLIQVFEPRDADLGACDDGSPCLVSFQTCVDLSECVLDEETACQDLIPIACDDNTGCAGTAEPLNASLCVPALVPGRTYYVMVGVKDGENRDTYTLEITTPCDAELPLPNDRCRNAELIDSVAGVAPFDLSGGDIYTPATLDCHTPSDVFPSMHNDVWYDWVAPCDGAVTVETCDRSLEGDDQPNTTMIVYEGCGCPVRDEHRIAWDDFCGSECGLSSCVTFEATAGQCYKVRLGGHLRGTPAGELSISYGTAPVVFLDPPVGVVDARQPHQPHDPSMSQGIDSFVVHAPVGANTTESWTVCETRSTGTENLVSDVIDHHDGTFTLLLDRPITPAAVTALTFTDELCSTYTGYFISHPGNVDGDGQTNASDVGALMEVLNGAAVPVWGHFSTDCNHSGSTTPADLICTINLLNGGDGFAPGYRDTGLPTLIDICP